MVVFHLKERQLNALPLFDLLSIRIMPVSTIQRLETIMAITADQQSQDQLKQSVAQAAVDYCLSRIEDRCIVGIGTGSTVNFFIDLLAAHKGEIEGTVASSEASADRLRKHGIPVYDLNGVDGVAIYIDGADEINPALEMIKGLLVEHKVLFFPGQNLSMSEHVELGHRFGHLEGHPNLGNPYPEHPEVFELAATRGGIADEWHSDLTFQESPSVMSVLKMVKCPELGGENH